ncbi:phage tail protein [Ornithinicoccus hortensis]|uniref:Phage tail-like protein n=1 Tax=Ornithinicoccus hortensis TaxID=82346 RepID=A0A542YUY5_9MICO|nr:phage tail protein [Ornithinicoccus hortensis]TQL51880.1 phage tail-like protein [Ornithinicoccus hortensis]
MRGTVTGLVSPHPLGETLPGLYAEDAFAQGLCAGLDEVLAPVIGTLDNLPAYLDLATAPDDLVPWLAHWVGMSVQASMPVERQRELLQSAVDLQGWLGTPRGVQLSLEALFGATAVVEESGGSAWSTDPHAALPGEPVPSVTVRVSGVGPGVESDRVEAVVAAVTPAHVLRHVEVSP